jgi:hypothetical protein
MRAVEVVHHLSLLTPHGLAREADPPVSEEGAPARNNRVRTRNRRFLICGLTTSAAGATGGYAPGSLAIEEMR